MAASTRVSRISLGRAASRLAVALIAVVLGATVLADPASAAHRTLAAGKSSSIASAFEPVKIAAPAIKLNAKISEIAVSRGNLIPPKAKNTVGWDRGTSLPGATGGTTVMAGHTIGTKQGVFAKLGKLKSGNVVTVTTKAAGKLKYKVTSVKAYAKTGMAKRLKQLYADSGPNQLVLITCSKWNGAKHVNNTIVVATRVG